MRSGPASNKPDAQFQDVYTLDEILASPHIDGPLTWLQCSQTSGGAAAAILMSEDAVVKFDLGDQAVRIAGQAMATDFASSFDTDDARNRTRSDCSHAWLRSPYCTKRVPLGLEQGVCMGALTELGLEVPDSNRVQRLMQHIVASKPGAWLFSKFLYGLDKPLFKLSKGRITVPSLVAGLPVVMLTTTGRKSGDPRTMPLLGIPSGDDVAVIGSNFGQEHTPGWVYNLESDPAATIGYGDTEVAVTARRANDAETDATFETASMIYPGYRNYRARADHREIRVFVLEVADGPGAA
jgi:deazaflavin-dependent oxidoreductase (nitroreductase family)